MHGHSFIILNIFCKFDKKSFGFSKTSKTNIALSIYVIQLLRKLWWHMVIWYYSFPGVSRRLTKNSRSFQEFPGGVLNSRSFQEFPGGVRTLKMAASYLLDWWNSNGHIFLNKKDNHMQFSLFDRNLLALQFSLQISCSWNVALSVNTIDCINTAPDKRSYRIAQPEQHPGTYFMC